MQDASKYARLDELYGDGRWRPALTMRTPQAKEQFLLQQYRQALEEKGWKCLIFRMINVHNQTQYHLIYGTTHYLGMLAMKQAMWSAIPEGTFTFSDLSNPSQLALFAGVLDEDYSRDLAGRILQRWRGQTVSKQIVIEQELARHPTAIHRHLTRALLMLEHETDPPGIIRVQKASGSPRRAKTYPDDSSITFAP